jgi:peroxiredoxin
VNSPFTKTLCLVGATLSLALCFPAPTPGAASLAAQMRALHIDTPRERLPAPAFALASLDGKTVRLQDYRGQLVALHFWATFCKPCRKELPALDQLSREFADRGFAVLAIAVDRDHPQAVENFVREHAIRLTVPLDPGGEVRKQYEIDALPTSYLIGPDGRFVGRVVGERDWTSPAFKALIGELASTPYD